MKKEFVTHKIALKFKKLGFNEPCFGYYHNGILSVFHNTSWSERVNKPNPICDDNLTCTAPTWQQAQRWLRECHNKHIIIAHDKKRKKYDLLWSNDSGTFDSEHDSYEEAIKIGIKNLINQIK